MRIVEPIGSEIARLIVMICAQNMYQMKDNDHYRQYDIHMMYKMLYSIAQIKICMKNQVNY